MKWKKTYVLKILLKKIIFVTISGSIPRSVELFANHAGLIVKNDGEISGRKKLTMSDGNPFPLEIKFFPFAGLNLT